ncbi:hypothetical protein Back11_06970 [Paenibacillus baekrokdamisoli]|uniref:Uncharacterized protein n=1 Tax=Paenibacillus baekrokdamisoli TaxID=1712516 RepID=A0A3G9IM99_9BACL|nr:DUF2164 domain-containing protein [Paenibacillus baekrokdamisoli]MBB3067461.1 uncharacterized protein (DUF2164 family) [Paenibacillus baekrokdamisoli]BBH19352.1 hypothetical protein Back11_06970 [Paenibacillus baekrokdamisoli]
MIPIKLPREQKEQIMEKLVAYFEEERSEKLGNIGAEQIIDFMLREIAPFVYNKAVDDARQIVNQKSVSLEEELYALERRL